MWFGVFVFLLVCVLVSCVLFGMVLRDFGFGVGVLFGFCFVLDFGLLHEFSWGVGALFVLGLTLDWCLVGNVLLL